MKKSSRGFMSYVILIASFLLIAVMLVFTVWSGINYIKGGWKFISTDW